jgi:hypothetical protein
MNARNSFVVIPPFGSNHKNGANNIKGMNKEISISEGVINQRSAEDVF